jgi:hypothetical protein
MNRLGCIGLVIGSLIGSVMFSLLLWSIQTAVPPLPPQGEPIPADISLFLSERTASRFAAQALQEPTAIQFEPGGTVIVTTRVKIAGLKPVVDLGLSLERRGNVVVTQLYWLQVGLLKVPARWLPAELVALGATPGEVISQQLPPQTNLVGLSTTADGVTLQLNWAGQ